MSSTSKTSVPSVLIVESEDGNVFIVEDKESKSQVEKILKFEPKNIKRPVRARQAVQIIPRDPTPLPEDEEIKEEEELYQVDPDEEYTIITEINPDDDCIVEEYLDEYIEETDFKEEIIYKDEVEPKYEIIYEMKAEDEVPEAIMDHQYMLPKPTFDGVYSSDELIEYSEEENLTVKEKLERSKSGKPQKHKFRQLTGKTACKYCDTIFRSKDSLRMHVCKYLQCDPKNYICRICKKELSRKTFSNHLHETLDCQYCHKKFVNPRNLRMHLEKMHKDEKFIPPKSPDREFLVPGEDETLEPLLDESTGLMVKAIKPPKKKYPRQTGRFECDLCGRIFTTMRSLKIHMDLHTNSHRYVCQTCGEKYATHTGLAKHACLNKRRKRPEVDFRIFDVRHCKFCGLSFACLEDNKAHKCEYQFENDPKMFRCRFCSLPMSKNSYNKHMVKHISPDVEWVCGFCDKKLADENTLNLHLTTHTGDKPYKCPQEDCGQSFINRQLLVRHSRFHGVQIPTYKCKVCNKEVASKYHLKSHMKIHSDLFECQLCKEQCESREELKEHYQASHLPYVCEYCDKSFILPRYLKMHLKLHLPTEEKPHKCEYCAASKSFSKLALLLNHILKCHPDMFEEYKQSHPEIFQI